MNWLAHLRLAPSSPLVRLGNLAGDFVRGVDTAALHPDLPRGIAQHRAVASPLRLVEVERQVLSAVDTCVVLVGDELVEEQCAVR